MSNKQVCARFQQELKMGAFRQVKDAGPCSMFASSIFGDTTPLRRRVAPRPGVNELTAITRTKVFARSRRLCSNGIAAHLGYRQISSVASMGCWKISI